MGRVKGSGKYIYLDGDSKHAHSLRQCAQCGIEYLGRVDNKSRYCSQRCSGKATGFKNRPPASRAGYLLCTKCGEEKPEGQFDLYSRARNGRRPHCKACRAQEFQRRQGSPEFRTRQADINRRWQVENRARATAKVRRWRAANPLASRAIGHRRRIRKHGSTVAAITATLLAAKWEFWAGRCWMCGGEATEIDHVKPLAKGGAHILANLRPACGPCNRRKSGRWPYRPKP